ncbi:MAG: hypothetical protein A2268_09170 [Candidatus Raymondbacteria bacterium RifOxyA12_full_50_37]|uniref:SH3b domain-containing protein n=1 Tax=Candidatus Raymondbacteria bacterium RIFOXYD12_FULL_49_13 TaxID=1817890 RepID=A0A1F7F9B4_UNCRA|nr:MAG: hypothetical protein A2248_05400 [Candidatus Raymondbacteria bacterium RIFOXYA2_FULL_49_16]OGJ88724.1 MAG: hypothetical protein A2268_09170 [Candidatus Raymondbacteria bacterium RifOxyA12_full_50_37]OGJ97719.1 MAG: hypothetical protein A2453_09760 [Candidatus Raymondbacteria bacterium RIFOXYC2_FULL_50_21]OGK03168.1 MAG: hypothetical protein A2519_00005 [Candidatus Raymondbacteria bacterium RIFOXYD12_FULL_49_13]OGP43620.1 MAG: hypothetical protein A2324_09365 [Candidatus Raymondbacteria 
MKTITIYLCLICAWNAAAVEKITPVIYFCAKDRVVLRAKPMEAADSTAQTSFGVPVIALARHQGWLGIYLDDGTKAWALEAAFLTREQFQAAYPYINFNEEFLSTLLSWAQGVQPKQTASQAQVIKIKGESEEVYIKKGYANIYSKPNTHSRVLRETYEGEAFQPVNMIRGWYQVEYDENSFGWIAEDMAQPDTIEIAVSPLATFGSVKSDFAYVYSDPLPTANIKRKAKKGLIYEIVTPKEGWYKIRLDETKFGWINSGDFYVVKGSRVPPPQTVAAEPGSPATRHTEKPGSTQPLSMPDEPRAASPAQTLWPEFKFINKPGVNIRSDPSTKSPAIKKTLLGQVYQVQRYDSIWSVALLEDNLKGYVATSFLSGKNEVAPLLQKECAIVQAKPLYAAGITVPAANMFSGPSDKFTRIVVVDMTDTLLVLGSFGEWSRAAVISGGIGWIYTPYLKKRTDKRSAAYCAKSISLAPFATVRSNGRSANDSSLTREVLSPVLKPDAYAQPFNPAGDSSLMEYIVSQYKAIVQGIDSISQGLSAELEAKKNEVKQLDQADAVIKQDSLAMEKEMNALRAGFAQRLDSARLTINQRIQFLKDSLAAEKSKAEAMKAGNAPDPKIRLAEIGKTVETLKEEIKSNKNKSAKTRDRAANLKALAEFEFDVDTSAHAKDSLFAYASGLDSAAAEKEKQTAAIETEAAGLSQQQTIDVAAVLKNIDSTYLSLGTRQTEMFTGLLQNQKVGDDSAAQERDGRMALIQQRRAKNTAAKDAAAVRIAELSAAIKDSSKLIMQKTAELKERIVTENKIGKAYRL